MEAERLAHMLDGLDAQRLEHQRAIVQREASERGRHESIGRLPALQGEMLFAPDHPYARMFEHPEDVQAIGLAQVQWFFQTYYAPDHVTVVIAGGFDPDDADRLVQRYFGGIRRSAPAPQEYLPTVAPLGLERQVTFDW